MWTGRMKRITALAVSVLMVFSGLLVSTAQAGMVGTDEVIQEQQKQYDRDQLKSLLNNDEVEAKLLAMGVDKGEVKDRIDAMTPAELAELNQGIDEMPAGAGVLEVLLIIFLVFIVTDIIGATDIFPFVNTVER